MDWRTTWCTALELLITSKRKLRVHSLDLRITIALTIIIIAVKSFVGPIRECVNDTFPGPMYMHGPCELRLGNNILSPVIYIDLFWFFRMTLLKT